MALDRDLYQTLTGLPQVSAHNKLMRLKDRELALSLMYFNEQERQMVLNLVSPPKAARVRAELVLQERLNIRYGIYRLNMERVIEVLRSDQVNTGLKSYLRPIRFKNRSG